MSCHRAIVACNVYVSAGKPKHKQLLMDLLEKTQEHCLHLNTKNNSPKERVVVVHAFSDGPYDRSSFHLAGTPDLVAIVGSSLAINAVDALMCFETSLEEDDFRRIRNEIEQPIHPTVGLVDHVSILPLDEDINSIDDSDDDNNNDDDENITGSVARKIGEALSMKNVDVLYYGRAHPARTPLATVRRESTRFFHSPDEKKDNSGNEIGDLEEKNGISVGQTTVGATDRFVENYNIRLRPSVSRTVARSLTENIRERSGMGLPLVEALTLAYGSDQYEVACNLLDPSVTSAEDIEQRMRLWEKQHQKLLQNQQQPPHEQEQEQKFIPGLVDKSYRVGTTSNLCLNALREVDTMEREKAYNKAIKKGLGTYLCVSPTQQ
jgi:hypothetical protein